MPGRLGTGYVSLGAAVVHGEGGPPPATSWPARAGRAGGRSRTTSSRDCATITGEWLATIDVAFADPA